MAWTALTAAALWWAADQRWRLGALGRFVGVYGLAVAHILWRASASFRLTRSKVLTDGTYQVSVGLVDGFEGNHREGRRGR